MPIQPTFPDVTGLVLGGGQSRRMGRDKRHLLWEGEPFLDRVCRLMASVFDEVLVVTAHEDYECSHLPVRLVTDKIPCKGSLGGLYSGLLEAKHTCSFVVGCDMPFLNTACIARMCERSASDVLMVKLSTGVQPLHARYSKGCVTIIEQKIHEGDLKIQSLAAHPSLAIEILDESFFHEIDPYGKTFLNINTPSDFDYARKISLDSSRPK